MQMPQLKMPQAQAPHIQMPQVQPPHIQMPQVSMAPPAPPKIPDRVPAKAPGPNILLIAIFCLLAFLVGALLMVFLLKKDTPRPHAAATRQMAFTLNSNAQQKSCTPIAPDLCSLIPGSIAAGRNRIV
jgi:hypothetical protein